MTWGKVRALRADRERGETYRSLSQKYEISLATVAQIVTGKTWKESGANV